MLSKFKKRKRLRTHGYLSRSATATGMKVLKARRQKGRHVLTVSYAKRYQTTKGKSKLHIVAGGTARFVTHPGSNERFRVR
jgi:large subunit ribosomal protein L34